MWIPTTWGKHTGAVIEGLLRGTHKKSMTAFVLFLDCRMRAGVLCARDGFMPHRNCRSALGSGLHGSDHSRGAVTHQISSLWPLLSHRGRLSRYTKCSILQACKTFLARCRVFELLSLQLVGSASRGLYRVHQFSKVEMFVLSTPAQSEAMLQELCDIEEEIFTELGLHFQMLVRCLTFGRSLLYQIDILLSIERIICLAHHSCMGCLF